MRTFVCEFLWSDHKKRRRQTQLSDSKTAHIIEYRKHEIEARDLDHAKDIVDNDLIGDFEERFLAVSPMLERSETCWNKLVVDPNPKRVWSITNPKITVRSFVQKEKMVVRIKEVG